MTSLPNFEDYNVAVCNPSIFFSDPEIRRRVPVFENGQPVFFSGRYAYTFRLALPGGADPVAVRCFRQEVHDLVARYRAIDEFLAKLRSPFFVGFSVAAQGVLVKGRRWPAMRMDWVDHPTLTRFVRDHRNDSARLQSVRDGLLAYSRLTERSQFAHCDVHPDNILVGDGGHLRFVDYDGIFVPALRSFPSEVAGQVDYQSPLRMRDPSRFGAHLDRFPLMVLDLTLAALQQDPGIIARRTAGEGILLGQADFETPEESPILQEIALLPRLGGAVRVFREACRYPPEDLPPLDLMRSSTNVQTRPKLTVPRLMRPRRWARKSPRARWSWRLPLPWTLCVALWRAAAQVARRMSDTRVRHPLRLMALALVGCLAAVTVGEQGPSGVALRAPRPASSARAMPVKPVAKGDQRNLRKELVIPEKPGASSARKENGTVMLLVEIDRDGAPIRATLRASTGQPGLAAAAWSTVSAWRRPPTPSYPGPHKAAFSVTLSCERDDLAAPWHCMPLTTEGP